MAELSGTMKLALMSIETHPGLLAKELPGGSNTIRALMRRWKVEVQGDPWHVFLPTHEHIFAPSMHLDGCHSYQTQGICECGVQYAFFGERSLKGDPYSAIWMLDDDGGTECERCKALVYGARPRYVVMIVRPEHYPVTAPMAVA